MEVFGTRLVAANKYSGRKHHPVQLLLFPVIFTEEREFETWLRGPTEEAHALVHSFPADHMRIVQSGAKGPDLLGSTA